MNIPTPNFDTSGLSKASMEAKDLLADILIDAILRSECPEESKIEVRIMQAYLDLDDTLYEAAQGFSVPLPPSTEGKEVAKRVYPARKEFLEYLQLMKTGLDSFLAATPIPDIPPEMRQAAGLPPELR